VLSMRLRRMIPYDSIAVFVNRNGWLLPELVSGENFRMLSSLKIRVGEGLCGWVAENCKPIVNGNPQVEAGYVVDPKSHTTLESALVVPLEGLNGVVGVLAMYHTTRDAFTADHLRILLAVASKVALSVENALKYQQAESSATTDFLTGLPNARSLFVHLAQEVARCRRTKTPLAVMVCDIDGFKQINDSFGHLEGDRLLREFSTRLKDACRGYDYVARMGGDEFVVIAPGLPADAATKKIEQIRPLARQAGFDVCGEDILSLSVGVAVSPVDGNDAEQLLTEADRRMYLEKQKQPTTKDQRLHTRMKCRLTIELHPQGSAAPIFGNLIDISLGGCYVETAAILAPSSNVKVVFSMDKVDLSAEGSVARMHPGSGIAIQFKEMSRDSREQMYRILEFVQSTTTMYNDRYLQNLFNR